MTKARILPKERLCTNCWETFQPKRYSHGHAKYCSKKCHKDAHNRRQRERVIKALNEGITGDLYLKLRFEILKRDNFRCIYCGRNPKEDGTKLHIDHVIPKSKGGKFNADNLVTSCFECNEGKRDVLLSERLLRKRGI